MIAPNKNNTDSKKNIEITSAYVPNISVKKIDSSPLHKAAEKIGKLNQPETPQKEDQKISQQQPQTTQQNISQQPPQTTQQDISQQQPQKTPIEVKTHHSKGIFYAIGTLVRKITRLIEGND